MRMLCDMKSRNAFLCTEFFWALRVICMWTTLTVTA